MNVLFFLTPKAGCTYLYDDFSVRQAMEKMEITTYTSLPILSRSGAYRGTLTEGDLLWAMKNVCDMDIDKARGRNIMEIVHRQDNEPVTADTNVEDLMHKSVEQNFVPVVDDKGDFIGLVPRRAIVEYFIEKYEGKQEP